MRRIHKTTAEETPHANRPWVFFMVDCFFLITEFFVLTFKFKVEESVLPSHLPPGGTRPGSAAIVQSLRIHVRSTCGAACYEVLGEQFSLADLNSKLQAWNQTGQHAVRVSYEPKVLWGDVIAVFNTCKKAQISDCGLVPLRGCNVPQ